MVQSSRYVECAPRNAEQSPPLSEELGLDSADEDRSASEDTQKNTSLPVWLQPVTLDKWPTRPIENQVLRYALRIREGWSTTPQINATPITGFTTIQTTL